MKLSTHSSDIVEHRFNSVRNYKRKNSTMFFYYDLVRKEFII